MSQVVEKLRRKDYDSPFAGLNYVLISLVDPEGRALVTLSEIGRGEVVGLTLAETVNYLAKLVTSKHTTVLDVMIQKYLLYNVPRGRKRLKELVKVLRSGLRGVSAPVSLKPVKKILAGEEE